MANGLHLQTRYFERAREATDDDEPVYELDEQPIRRRSTRRGAGHHSNPYGLPRSFYTVI